MRAGWLSLGTCYRYVEINGFTPRSDHLQIIYRSSIDRSGSRSDQGRYTPDLYDLYVHGAGWEGAGWEALRIVCMDLHAFPRVGSVPRVYMKILHKALTAA